MVTPFHHHSSGTWTYVIADERTRDAVVIDPVLDYDWRSGRTGTASAQLVADHCEAGGLKVHWILETHAHADHLSSAPYLKDRLGGRVAIGQGICKVQATFKKIFGLGDDFAADGNQFDRLLDDDGEIDAGSLRGRVIATPGHTNDSVAYLFGDALFVGDTMFMPDSGSARCDFPGGDAAELYRSIQRMFTLPEDTRVFVCHDYCSGRSRAALRDDHPRAARREHPRPGRRDRAGIRGDAPQA